jgi:hypothetical protein
VTRRTPTGSPRRRSRAPTRSCGRRPEQAAPVHPTQPPAATTALARPSSRASGRVPCDGLAPVIALASGWRACA